MSHKRKKEDNRRLHKLYDKTKYAYGAGAWYDEKKDRFIKYSCHDKWTRTHCRRITRRKLNRTFDQYQYNSYRKIYDYWWNII